MDATIKAQLIEALNYAQFCQILGENLVYEFTDSVSPEVREEWQQEWYVMFKEGYWAEMTRLSPTNQVRGWMHEHFDECSFDTHSFQLKASL